MLEKSEILSVSDIIKTKELTDKAKFLYKNGFFEEPTRVEKIDDSYVDVTYKDGFKGLIVLEKQNKLFLAKAEAEEQNIYSYQLFELTDVTDTQYTKLQEIVESDKFNLRKLFGLVGLILSGIMMISFLFIIITLIIADSGFDYVVSMITTVLPTILVSTLLSVMLFREKK